VDRRARTHRGPARADVEEVVTPVAASSAEPGGQRVAVVLGTRPDTIKLAPVVHVLERSPHLRPIPVVTAQHREMLDPVLELFAIRPVHDLDVFRPGQRLAELTARMLEGLERVFEAERPDLVLVQGDTTTTFAAALAAYYRRTPVGHVEAGLRTHDRYAPYPEELNRRMTGALASLHFAPTAVARDNLLAEGVPAGAILVTGNTVIDALLSAVRSPSPYGDPALERIDRDPRRVLLVTAHRRESWGEPLRRVAGALAELAATDPGLLVVFPIHRNPTVRQAVLPALEGLENVVVTEPLPYGGFVRLMARSFLILTDSGGLQEEGPALGKPVLVMRDTTERPEAVRAGTARLIGTRRAAIVKAVRELLDDPAAYQAMARVANPFGDGRAAERVVAAVDHFFGLGPAPAPFEAP
jgi:UDP-N-acetylglucosamine 2-epimerase